jgi:hypothetical protein
LADSGQAVDITGHSLGGGLASAAAGASGASATTFNAAGLNPTTVARYGTAVDSAAAGPIQAYRVEGELLTGVQEQGLQSTAAVALAGGLVGGPMGAVVAGLAKVGLAAAMPNAVGTPHPLPGSGDPLARHGMDHVIPGIESQLNEDQQALSKVTGVVCP